MRLTYGNIVKGLYLFLLALSFLICLFKPSEQSALIAILSLVGFIAFDVVCQIKRKEIKDSPELLALQEQNKKIQAELDDLHNQFDSIKANISIGSIATAMRRK